MSKSFAGELWSPTLSDFPMPIYTPRLILRPPQLGDGEALNFAICESFQELHSQMRWANELPTVEQSEVFVRQACANWILKLNQKPYLPLFIYEKRNHVFLGSTGFHYMDWKIPCFEIGYWIRTSYHGQGFTTEAVNALTRYAIIELNGKRIEICCDVENIQGQKIPKHLGYHHEATLRSDRINFSTGKVSDTVVFVRHNIESLPHLEVSW